MNSKIKKGLGRGLSSLIGETKVENKTNKLNLSEIIPNKYQPRKNFDEDNLEDLSNSIKERGVIQPIIVRRSNSDDAKYEIIAGERRWLAARKAGLHDIPVVVTEADDELDIEGDDLKKVVLYSSTLAVPAQRNPKSEDVLKGKQLFSQIGCNNCHITTFKTHIHKVVPALSHQKIHRLCIQ